MEKVMISIISYLNTLRTGIGYICTSISA